ncbi:uncharacterized protein LOC111342531, partial [Stylophora pistillata]|uniref:uncharacterized protein LOC111342531 n=1 Tax=Stylophora pistillata TaxID=50429 RepID=UPI000C04C5A1
FVPEFRLNASEEGVRMIYLNLKIGNESYHSLESPRLFLPEKWVWVHSIGEPMLSLPYDYDILPNELTGRLTQQVRSRDAPLVDQPGGCLTSLNFSSQSKVVADAILSYTALGSEKTTEAVVRIKITDTETSDPLAWLFDAASGWNWLIGWYFLGMLLLISVIVASSCRLIVRMFSFIIMGFIFNAEFVTPFVTFLLAALTNIYLCYYNLQIRYQDVKQMISQKLLEQNSDDNNERTDKDSIPEDLFWLICGTDSELEHKVLPIIPEIMRMLRNMGLILVFLFLSWCSIIFLGDTYKISSVVSTILVLVTGVIPGFF